MIPTLAIIQGIVSVFRQSGPLAIAFPSWINSLGQTVFSFYQDLAPEGSPLPHLEYQVLAAPSSTVYGRVAFTEPSIRFTGYAADSVAVLNSMQAVISAFDELVIPMPAGNNQLLTLRMGDPVPRLSSRETTGSGNEVWEATVIYHFAAQ